MFEDQADRFANVNERRWPEITSRSRFIERSRLRIGEYRTHHLSGRSSFPGLAFFRSSSTFAKTRNQQVFNFLFMFALFHWLSRSTVPNWKPINIDLITNISLSLSLSPFIISFLSPLALSSLFNFLSFLDASVRSLFCKSHTLSLSLSAQVAASLTHSLPTCSVSL